MDELINLLIAMAVLILGIPIGNILRNKTKDEFKDGLKWFKRIVLVSLFFGFFGLFVGNDWIMFGFFFMAIVTSRSLVVEEIKKKK